MWKYISFVFLTVLFSCNKKENENCSICSTLWIISADQPVTGYPAMTTTTVELCDMTEEQLTSFEEANQGSESDTVNGILYSSSHSTLCTAKIK